MKKIRIYLLGIVTILLLSLLKYNSELQRIEFYDLFSLTQEAGVLYVLNIIVITLTIIISLIVVNKLTKFVARLLKNDWLFDAVEKNFNVIFLVQLLLHTIIVYLYALYNLDFIISGTLLYTAGFITIIYIVYKKNDTKTSLGQLLTLSIPMLVYLVLDIISLTSQF
jgi:hypothetical protein